MLLMVEKASNVEYVMLFTDICKSYQQKLNRL